MSNFTSSVSKIIVATGAVEQVYLCANTRTFSAVTLTVLLNSTTLSGTFDIAVTSKTTAGALVEEDYVIREISLVNESNIASISNIPVGPGERIYVRSNGQGLSVRTQALEDVNPKVLACGRLGSATLTAASRTQIYQNNKVGNKMATINISFYNPSATTGATIEAWVSTGVTENLKEKILYATLEKEKSIVLDQIIMGVDEYVYVRSSLAGVICVVTGVVNS